MKKSLYILTTVAIVALIATIAWAVNQSSTATVVDTSEATTIAEMFKQGLKTNKENNRDLTDADLFGAALVSIAWERLGNHPDAAPQMFTAFEQYVSGKTPRERYTLWDVFLENLEAALLKSLDAEHLKTNWVIRQKAVEKQTTALKEWADATGKTLDVYAQTVSALKTLDKIEPLAPDVQQAVEFLLGEAEAPGFDNAELQSKAAGIAKTIDGKLADIVTQFEKDVATEKQRDRKGIVEAVPDDTKTEGNDKAWKIGRYQELLDKVLPIVQLRENSVVTFWTAYRQDENGDASFFERLVKTNQEAKRMQLLRYSLWTVQVLSSDSSITNISHIDPGLLETSVNALYSQREAELMTQRPNERGGDVRKILLGSKVPLTAF